MTRIALIQGNSDQDSEFQYSRIPTNIMSESFLSFIGLGLQPPASSWGTLASEGFRAIRSFPHLIIFPGTILFITMLAFNYLGDGLRDMLDPKTRRSIDT